jgi:hypothetical protein
MNRVIALCFIVLLSFARTGYAQETSAYEVVSEYIRQLGAVERTRDLALKDMTDSADPMANAIRNSTRVKLELAGSIAAFQRMKLKKPFETLLPSMIAYYRQKITLHDEMKNIASAFVGGPKPGIDYGRHGARMPEITATLEFIDKALFDASPLFSFLLIDQRSSGVNGLNRLRITLWQRKALIDRINNSFGEKLDVDDQNYTVAAASVLRSTLLKDSKSSDEP